MHRQKYTHICIYKYKKIIRFGYRFWGLVHYGGVMHFSGVVVECYILIHRQKARERQRETDWHWHGSFKLKHLFPVTNFLQQSHMYPNIATPLISCISFSFIPWWQIIQIYGGHSYSNHIYIFVYMHIYIYIPKYNLLSLYNAPCICF